MPINISWVKDLVMRHVRMKYQSTDRLNEYSSGGRWCTEVNLMYVQFCYSVWTLIISDGPQWVESLCFIFYQLMYSCYILWCPSLCIYAAVTTEIIILSPPQMSNTVNWILSEHNLVKKNKKKRHYYYAIIIFSGFYCFIFYYFFSPIFIIELIFILYAQ